MYLSAEDDFTLLEDFDEVKASLIWLAEQFLPVGARYMIVYDPNRDRAFGRGRGRKVLCLRAGADIAQMTSFREAEHRPPRWEAAQGCYLVLTRIASGEPPTLPDDWRARRQLRYDHTQLLRQAIEETRENLCTSRSVSSIRWR